MTLNHQQSQIIYSQLTLSLNKIQKATFDIFDGGMHNDNSIIAYRAILADKLTPLQTRQLEQSNLLQEVSDIRNILSHSTPNDNSARPTESEELTEATQAGGGEKDTHSDLQTQILLKITKHNSNETSPATYEDIDRYISDLVTNRIIDIKETYYSAGDKLERNPEKTFKIADKLFDISREDFYNLISPKTLDEKKIGGTFSYPISIPENLRDIVSTRQFMETSKGFRKELFDNKLAQQFIKDSLATLEEVRSLYDDSHSSRYYDNEDGNDVFSYQESDDDFMDDTPFNGIITEGSLALIKGHDVSFTEATDMFYNNPYKYYALTQEQTLDLMANHDISFKQISNLFDLNNNEFEKITNTGLEPQLKPEEITARVQSLFPKEKPQFVDRFNVPAPGTRVARQAALEKWFVR